MKVICLQPDNWVHTIAHNGGSLIFDDSFVSNYTRKSIGHHMRNQPGHFEVIEEFKDYNYLIEILKNHNIY